MSSLFAQLAKNIGQNTVVPKVAIAGAVVDLTDDHSRGSKPVKATAITPENAPVSGALLPSQARPLQQQQEVKTPAASFSSSSIITPSTATLTAQKRPLPSDSSAAKPSKIAKALKPTKAPKPLPKSKQPHVLIWVCHHGPGRGSGRGSGGWTQKSLRIVGVYSSKDAAEEKKESIMNNGEYICGGHGDIVVGDCWDDEIDLLIRPAGEFAVEQEQK